MKKKLCMGFQDKILLEKAKSFFPEAEYRLVGPDDANLDNISIVFLNDELIANYYPKVKSADRPTFVATTHESASLSKSFLEGIADDLITLPLRAHDLSRVIRFHDFILSLRELESSSLAVPDLVYRLQEDIHLAQKIQRKLIKDKFPSMGGLNIKAKYWCGLKAGGDYFDVFEFPGGSHYGILLTDCSSYSLSSHVISSLIHSSMHQGAMNLDNPREVLSGLFQKIKTGMKDTDIFSIFFGIINRNTLQLRYVDCGAQSLCHRRAKDDLKWLERGKNPPLTLASQNLPETEELSLDPGDRLFLFSDGFKREFPTLENMVSGLEGKNLDAQDFLNEISFKLRKGIELKDGEPFLSMDPDAPLPEEDCSVMVFDVAKNTLRLAK